MDNHPFHHDFHPASRVGDAADWEGEWLRREIAAIESQDPRLTAGQAERLWGGWLWHWFWPFGGLVWRPQAVPVRRERRRV